MRRLFVALLLVGCGTEAPAPAKPTWVDDVQPILAANCFHCHGPTADLNKYGTMRWDILDLTPAPYAELGFTENRKVFLRPLASLNDSIHFSMLRGYVTSDNAAEKRMPPPPATLLSARDVEVLANWAANDYAPGQHHPNHKPRIAWLVKNKTFAVTDEDGDQVLGKLDCGGTEVQVLFAGSHDLPSGASGPCTGGLFDGWGTTVTSVTLK
jgi:hypothetical protein